MIPSQVNLRKLNLTRRIIYLLVAVVVVLPYVVNLPLPFKPTKDATDLFNRVDELKTGSHVLLCFDYDPSSQAELYPMSQAVLRHCFQKGLIPIVMTHNQTGVGLAKKLVEDGAGENWETCSEYLRGVPLPCTKGQLIQHAQNTEMPGELLHALGEFPNRTYGSMEAIHKEAMAPRIHSDMWQACAKYLRGASFPASKEKLSRHAQTAGAPKDVLHALNELPDRKYDGPEAVRKEGLSHRISDKAWEMCAKYLQSAAFPCKKRQMIEHAEKLKAPEGVLYVLGELPDLTYGSLEQIRHERIFQRIPRKKLESGRDYVLLGFKTGGYALIVNMGENLKGAFDRDFYDQPTASMPALQGVNSLKNMKIAIEFTASDTITGMWIPFGSDRYGFPLGVGTTAVQAPNLIPFVKSGQIVGFLGGLRGAADYESLVKAPGDATRGMQSQSTTHVLMIVLILGANIRLLAGRLARRRKD